MGPIALFDKSFLQSLNIDQSVWFNHFYLCNICPLFYNETLSDLEKEMKNGRTPEEVVGNIADKFPESGSPNVFHEKACLSSLFGNPVPMYGQILVPNAAPAKKDDKTGLVIKPSSEIEALSRWQSRDFLEVERISAREWRINVSNIDLCSLTDYLMYFPFNYKDINSPKEALGLVEDFIKDPKYIMSHFYLSYKLSNIPTIYHHRILSNWQFNGMKPFTQYAPYAAYILTIDLVFIISLFRGFVSDQRPSNSTDIDYLKYIPFSHVFVSHDRLHRMLAPLFLRDDQVFIWGSDLKDDLKNLNEYYITLPEDVRKKGLDYFASSPPNDDNYITTRLWKRYLNSNLIKDGQTFNEPKHNPKMARDISNYDVVESSEEKMDPDFILIERKVSKKKGSWQVLPEDIK